MEAAFASNVTMPSFTGLRGEKSQQVNGCNRLAGRQPKSRAKLMRTAPVVLAKVESGQGKSSASKAKIIVCTNKPCRQDGAMQTLLYIEDLAPSQVPVETCSCLGKCGSGPNIMLLPSQLVLSHVNTPAHIARMLERQYKDLAGDAGLALKAMELKLAGNNAMTAGRHAEALECYTSAIALQPLKGIEKLHSNRSSVKLALGDVKGALEDARKTVELAPSWSKGYLRVADASEALGDYKAALDAYEKVAEIEPQIAVTAPFREKVENAKKKAGL